MLYRTRRRLCGPQAKAVMVFARENDTLASGVLQIAHNAVGIEVRRVENGGVLVTIAPLFVRECVDREMKEVILLHLAP